MYDLRNFFSDYEKIFKNKVIIKIILLSFLSSISIVAIIFFYLWDLAPYLSWIKFLFGEFYNKLTKIFWNFIIFSFLIFLIPPIFSVIVSFFLDDIVEEVYKSISIKNNIKFKSLSYISGIMVSLKIIFYVTLIFLLIVFLKFFYIKNAYIALTIQFLLSSIIISKEYSSLIYYKFSKRNPSTLTNIYNGILCNLLFYIPVINALAPVLTTIFITTKFIKEEKL